MTIPIGLNIWSRLVGRTMPYLDQAVAPFDSIWMPDHVQYGSNDVSEGWTLLEAHLDDRPTPEGDFAAYMDAVQAWEAQAAGYRHPVFDEVGGLGDFLVEATAHRARVRALAVDATLAERAGCPAVTALDLGAVGVDPYTGDAFAVDAEACRVRYERPDA